MINRKLISSLSFDDQLIIFRMERNLERRMKKYSDVFSASKGSLDVFLPKNREEVKEFAIAKRYWEIKKAMEAKTFQSVFMISKEFDQKKSEFYKTVTTSQKTKAYFHDLDLTDPIQLKRLLLIAEAFFRSISSNASDNQPNLHCGFDIAINGRIIE